MLSNHAALALMLEEAAAYITDYAGLCEAIQPLFRSPTAPRNADDSGQAIFRQRGLKGTCCFLVVMSALLGAPKPKKPAFVIKRLDGVGCRLQVRTF